MANRIILNTVSFHGKGAIGEIPGIAMTKGFQYVFVCSDPDLVKFGVTAKVTDLLYRCYGTADHPADRPRFLLRR